MSKVKFGIIFKLSKIDTFDYTLLIDSIVFTLDDVIMNGKYVNVNVKEDLPIHMIKVVKDDIVFVKNNEYMGKDGKDVLHLFNVSLGKDFDKSLNSLIDICFKFTLNPLRYNINSNTISLNKTIHISIDETETVKSYYCDMILDSYSKFEKNVNKDFDDDNVDIVSILNRLKDKIKGQDNVIDKVVPNVILNKRIINTNNKDLIRTCKSTILLEGETGTGKTLLVSELANLIDCPFVIKNATNYSTVGYVGEDLRNILVDLLIKTNFDLEVAQKGIVCLDEVDKLGDSNLEIRKGLMHEILTWLSGTTINVKYKSKEISFDTSRLTFIFLGAFTSMREKNNVNTIGFSNVSNSNKVYSTKDHVDFGMLREFMGRINIIATLNKIDYNTMKDILVNSSISPLTQFMELCNLYGVSISYTDDFIDTIVNKALSDGIGARGLIRQMNEVRARLLLPIMTNEVKDIVLDSNIINDNEYKRTLI